MTYDLHDRNYKSPATILEILKQEYPKPSDFMNAYHRLLSETRKEQEERKQRFLNLVSQTLNITTEQVIQKAYELFRKSYEHSENERIARMEKANEVFRKSHEYSEREQIEPFSKEEIERDKESLPSRIEKAVQEATDRDTLNALRMNVEGSGIEAAWKEWEDASGFANALEYEIVNWPDSVFPVNSVPAPIEPETPLPDEPPFSQNVMESCEIRHHRPGDYRVVKSLSRTVNKLKNYPDIGVITVGMLRKIKKVDGRSYTEGTLQRTLYTR